MSPRLRALRKVQVIRRFLLKTSELVVLYSVKENLPNQHHSHRNLRQKIQTLSMCELKRHTVSPCFLVLIMKLGMVAA